jgi:hypothetical protein
MSDVPELDRMLEEHETFRRNVGWMRLEHQHYFGFLCMVSAVGIAVLYGVFGFAAVALFPLVWRLAEYVVPRPVRRDPFQRYMVK